MSKRTRPKASGAKSSFGTSAGKVGLIVVVLVAGAAVWRWKSGVPVVDSSLGPTTTGSNSIVSSTSNVVSVLPQAIGAGQTNEADPTILVQEGTELFYKGDAAGALEKYSKALKLSPEDEEVQFNMARAFTVLGRTNEAIRHYVEALRILPDYAEAHNNLGNLLVALKRHAEALEHFSAALKVNPESSLALNNLGRCLAEMGQTKEAAVQFSEAVRLHPDYLEAHFNLGAALASMGNYEEAIRHYEKVLELEPDFAPARDALQRVRTRQAARKTP